MNEEDRNIIAQMRDVGRRLIDLASEKGDFVTGADGFVLFWPEGNKCGLAAWEMHVLADELDRRNELAQKNLDAYFETQLKCGDTGGTECPYSPTGFHIVDTSMESGPNNCFHCETPMPRGKP